MKKQLDRKKLIERYFATVDHTATRSSYKQIAHNTATRSAQAHEIDWSNVVMVTDLLTRAYERRAAADQEKKNAGSLVNE